MLKRIKDFIPNDHNCEHYVLLYHNYRLVDKFPSSVNADDLFCLQCAYFGFELPRLCKSAIFRFPSYIIKVKDYGEYQLITLKHLKNYEQNPKH